MASLDAAEAAEYLGVTKQTLYAYVSRGLLVSEASLHGRERRYPLWALDELKARRAERREPEAAALRWGTPVLESALTLIDQGRLFYRGRDAIQLSRHASFEEVAGILWETDPTELFPASTKQAVRKGPITDRLIATLVSERARLPLSLIGASTATLRAAGESVAALFGAAGATGAGALPARLARAWRTDAEELRAALILCADHELNASAFAARVVAATDAPLHNALLAALCAVEGRRHGGVGSEVVTLLDETERVGVRRAAEAAIARLGWLPGFWSGEGVYRAGDPRAREIFERADLSSRDPASKVLAFGEALGSTPTIDFALAALSRSRGLPREAAFTLFALGRSVGWVAHALEAAKGQLIRPRARYVGIRPQMALTSAERDEGRRDEEGGFS